MTPAEALNKTRALCAKQERCRFELRVKLDAWGVREADAGKILGQLEKEGFLNEGRFAEHYAVSKLRQKGWGRVKIRYALKAKHVDEGAIAGGLAAIDEEEYIAVLLSLAKKHWTNEKAHERFERTQRVLRFLKARGFEGDAVRVAMQKVTRS